jgi:hypothetical protein
MDNMLRDRKDTQENLKDSSENLGISLTDTGAPISYRKTEKLITALYMVTDIIDKDEPLRNKLRTLGTGIISDINSPAGSPLQALSKISEIMSFLDIASAMNIISQMNTSILRKEFLELDQSIRESSDKASVIDRKIDLTEFFSDEGAESHPSLLRETPRHVLPEGKSVQGHTHKLGVQKGSTLMKAVHQMSDRISSHPHPVSDRVHEHVSHAEFDRLKKERRGDIINIIKIMGGSATIKDIKDKADSLFTPSNGGAGRMSILQNTGEKTLQRELAGMVEEGVLKKTGQKRWSKYFIN